MFCLPVIITKYMAKKGVVKSQTVQICMHVYRSLKYAVKNVPFKVISQGRHENLSKF